MAPYLEEIFECFFNFTGDFPGAIQLLFEAKDAAKTYSHFRAIQQLSHNLQDTLELAEEQLDVALSKVCIDFKESTYARLQVLFNLFKVQIFWEGHTILAYLPLSFQHYLVEYMYNHKRKMCQIFVAFSEYLNFTTGYNLKSVRKVSRKKYLKKQGLFKIFAGH